MKRPFGACALLMGSTVCIPQPQQRPAPEVWHEVAVTSANQRIEARIRKADGQESVADVLARWRLSVRSKDLPETKSELWSCVIRHRPGERLRFVTDDGSAYVEVDAAFDSKRDLVRVWRTGSELCTLNESSLGLDLDRAARSEKVWLAEGERAPKLGWIDTPHGPTAQLFLQLRAGGERRVDLETGEVFSTREWVGEIEVAPTVDPKLRSVVKSPIVAQAGAPARIHWGDVLEIAVSGHFPTPNWTFAGFDAKLESESGKHIVLTAQSIPPPDGSAQLQVLKGFQAKAQIAGLTPGRWQVDVIGREEHHIEPIDVEVLPARALVELRTQGGILGLDDNVRVFANGVAAASFSRREGGPWLRVLTADEFNAVRAALGSLPVDRKDRFSPGADMFRYTLRWTADGKDREWSFDDGTLEAGATELVRVLRGLTF